MSAEWTGRELRGWAADVADAIEAGTRTVTVNCLHLGRGQDDVTFEVRTTRRGWVQIEEKLAEVNAMLDNADPQLMARLDEAFDEAEKEIER